MNRFSDKILLVISAFLTIAGLWLVFSASSTLGLLKNNDLASYFNHQMVLVFLAVLPFAVGLLVPYKFYRKTSVFMMLFVLLLLIIVLFSEEKKGATRWLNIGPFGIQPAELAKIVLILHLARLSVRFGSKIQNMKKLLLPLGWIGLFMFLVILQPNFSTALIIGTLGFVMIYVGGAKFKHLVGIALLIGVFIVVRMWQTDYSHKRLVGWLGANGTETVSAPSRQVEEALIGLGSGGLEGVGLGKSQQANLFLPEAYGDFIFAILGEETGFVGTMMISTLYIIFFLMALLTLNHIEDDYGKLIVFGLSFNIVLSAIINIAVVLGIFPTTGIPLPFISYGGSSLWVFVFSVGVILNVTAKGEIWHNVRNSFLKGFSGTVKFFEKMFDGIEI